MTSKRKIMIVDDDKDIRSLLGEILKSKGYSTVEVSNADECIKQVNAERPDLIIMDLSMPGTPVHKSLEKLRNFKVLIFSVVLSKDSLLNQHVEVPSKKDYPNIVGYVNKLENLDNFVDKIHEALK
jgi:two-component system, NtrC family, nitrogen regulation response regulator GlnG